MSNKLFSFFSKDSEPTTEPVKTLTPEMYAFLEHFPTAVLLLENSGKIVFANMAASALLRTKVSALTSSTVDRFGLTMTQVRSMTDAQNPQKMVLEVVTTEADSLTVSVGATILASTPFIMLTLEDVPHFQQLKEEKAFFASILNKEPQAIVVQNFAGICVFWNKHAEELFGHKVEQVEGKSIYDLLPKEMEQAVRRLDEELRKKQESRRDVQFSCKKEDGKDRVLSVDKEIIPGPDGKPRYILSLFDDVTERSEKEHVLSQKQILLQAILDNVPLGLYTRDNKGVMTYFNKQSMKVLNEADPTRTDKPHALQSEDQVEFHRVREAQILQEGKRRDFPEEIYTDAEGNKIILHMIKVPLWDAGPNPVVLTIVEDITARRLQEKEIKRVNGLLSAILQNAPMGLYARTADGRMLLRNRKCADLFGEETESAFDSTGKLPHETVEQVNAYVAREQELLRSGQIIDIPEEPYVTAAGEERLLHLIKVPVKEESGQESFVVTMVEDVTEKRAQERSLIETKNSLQTILEYVPVAIYARKVDDTLCYINRRAHEIFPDEREYVAKDDFYGQREKNIFKEGKVLEFPEEWYTTLRGDKILLHLIKAPVFDKEGNPFMVLTVAEDITEKKQQEKAIVDAKNFLQTVIDQLPLSLSVKNYDGKYILWNKKSEDLFGVGAADVIGRTSYRADINREQAEFLRESDLRVFENKKEQDIPQELISTAADGVKIMHTVKTPVFNSDGTPNCLLVVSEDITAKTRMEKQIREASDKNTLLVENAREGIVILDDGKIIYTNRAFCHILGYEDPADIKGKALLDFAAEDHRPFLKDKCDSVLVGADNASNAMEVHFVKKKGGEVEAEFAAVASKYLGRRITLCFVRDVTTSNRMLRDMKTERESLRSAFEKSITPSFILSSKGYITVMNEACRNLFGFAETDKKFYRNVYIKPAIRLAVRKNLKMGQPAQMDYTFDFDRAAEKFPGRIEGTGQLHLSANFVPINKRDTKDGTVEADYIVFLEKKEPKDEPEPPSSVPPAPKPPVAPIEEPKAPVVLPPPPPEKPQQAPAALSSHARETLVLPNSEPYALCSKDFKILSCNALFRSLCQLEENELIGQPIMYVFHSDFQAALTQDLFTLSADGAISNREYRLNLASGLESTSVRVSAVKEADGRYLFVLRNLAFHQQIMRILEERSAQLNALLEATDGIVFSVWFEKDRFGQIEQANKFLSRKLGYSHEELVRMSFADLFTNGEGAAANPAQIIAQAEGELSSHGKTSFRLPVRKKDGEVFEAQVMLSALDLPSKDAALVIIYDLSQQLDRVAKDSKEAKELKCVRQALPGLYLKTDSEGLALEVYSNLDYLDNEQTQDIFLDRFPGQYWSAETASRALFAIKEALSINVSTRFEFEWEVSGKVRYYEVLVTPISGCGEAVLWIKDVSGKHAYDEKVHELYRITREPGLSLTEQVEKILAFGRKIFRSDVGLVLRFHKNREQLESTVAYATKNDLHLERHMEFAVEECLTDVADGNVVLISDGEALSCTRCLHKAKGLNALLAAPLYMGGKVTGALCFASQEPCRNFPEGAEELIGIMARILSLRLELRQTGKMLSEASRSLAKTLEYVEMPAVIIGLDYHVTFVNHAMLRITGRRTSNMLGRDFFEEVIRNDDLSKQMFKAAEKSSTAQAFQVRLDLLHENGLYEDTPWDVFVCKNAEGKVDGYALIASAV